MIIYKTKVKLVSIIRFLVFIKGFLIDLEFFLQIIFLIIRIILVWLQHFLVNLHIYGSTFYLAPAQSQCLMAVARDSGLSTLCHSCGFACQQRALKTFPSPGYLCFKDGVVWLWHFLVILHIYGSPFYLATAQSQYLIAIERHGGLSTLCHNCRFGSIPVSYGDLERYWFEQIL